MTYDEKKKHLEASKLLYSRIGQPNATWLIEELEKAWSALEWYADPKNHEIDDANGYYPEARYPIGEDEGKIIGRKKLRGDGNE